MIGELEHAVKFRCNQSCTLHEMANTSQDVRKTTNIGKYSQFRSSSFKGKEDFRVQLKEKPKEKMAEVTKERNTCTNVDQQTIMPITSQRQRIKYMALKKSHRNMNQTMGYAIREKSDDDQDPREEFVEE
ncbi:hypothetical protein O181_068420 [Austropuccinia psidii MF-1]|uniref:Uncharacterized protein n=1 Tax=Austropuccinia psidii MF-1 TaxID=1389203 RepID=A0A9Q3ESI2_9BASI|nr:hypothetical protein [Austropuccinia psidii MF-1]